MRTIGIIVFPDVELLDATGPFEVFSVAARILTPAPCQPMLLGTSAQVITVSPGITLQAHQVWPHWEAPDILVIPGGIGIRAMLQREDISVWVGDYIRSGRRICTVCTGAWWLAKLGALAGKTATTHQGGKDKLLQLSPTTIWSDDRVVAQGQITTSGGISAGIDMAIDLCAQWWGPENAQKIADYMEYPVHFRNA